MSGINSEYKPLHNICEFLNALHVYTDSARENITRYIEATHYCSHVNKDLRQCLIYDSTRRDARLIGVEFMVPKHVYSTLPDEEKKLWHSHDFEVKSGMLILPKPDSADPVDWERAETEAMKEIVGLYGKTWHFWQVDRGDSLPLGRPTLMGSFTDSDQVDLNTALSRRNGQFDVDHQNKARIRRDIESHDVHPLADSWWAKSPEK